MSEELIVKGKVIGKGKPLVCVPVMGISKEEILSQVKALADKGTEMIEWRVDCYENAGSMNGIREIFNEIKEVIKDSILVYTYRSLKQGGKGNFDDEAIYDIHQVAAECKVADFIDVEYFALKHAKKHIKELQKMGAFVIASHHDFEKTPENKVMELLLEDLYESGADIVKMAVMPQKIYDVLDLLKVTAEFHDRHEDTPVVTMSMGDIGSVSRISGEYFGSCITFGCDGEVSAPGQLPQKELEEIVKYLHKSIG